MYKIKKENILLIVAIVIYFSIGPVFYHLPIKLVYVIVFIFLFVLQTKPINISTNNIILYCLLFIHLITTAITSIANNSFIPFIFSSVFALSFYSALQYNLKDIRRLTEILTVIFKYILILAWIGLFYSIFFKPLFSILYLENNLNFYLTTFGGSYANFTRPTGIYDEPGALSFFICLLVSYRTVLKLNPLTSLFLLLGGLVTQSLAHVIFLIVWVISETLKFQKKEKRQLLRKVIFIISLFILSIAIYETGILQWQIERTMGWVENPESAQRIIAFKNVLSEIDNNTYNLFFGFDKSLVARTTSIGNFGENILTPLVFGGLLAAWPLYLFVCFCIIYPLITFKRFYLIAIGLMLFQRPYFLELPYSFCIAIFVTLLINEEKIIIDKTNIYT